MAGLTVSQNRRPSQVCCSADVVYKVRSRFQMAAEISVGSETGWFMMCATMPRLRQGRPSCLMEAHCNKAARVFSADCSMHAAITPCMAFRSDSNFPVSFFSISCPCPFLFTRSRHQATRVTIHMVRHPPAIQGHGKGLAATDVPNMAGVGDSLGDRSMPSGRSDGA